MREQPSGRIAPVASQPFAAVVLGGGVAGLYAGRRLAQAGARVTLLEREAVVGGLAASRKHGENYYDLGVHHLHAFDAEIFEDIRTLMGPRLLPVKKIAKIRYGRGYRRYPLEFLDMLRGIPTLTLTTSLFGLTVQMLRNKVAADEPTNAEEALVQLYGRPLYNHFFREFTEQYWGFAPDRLSATFVRTKMPRLSAVDMLKKALAKIGGGEGKATAVESAVRDETLWYSATGSRGMPEALAAAIRRDGGRVLTGAGVSAVDVSRNRVVSVTYAEPASAARGPESATTAARVPCDFVVSTIPLPALVRALRPAAPATVRAAARRLRYRPIAVYGLLVRRRPVLDALYVYFRDRVFHRVAEPGNSGLAITPEGHSILLAEVTCSEGDDFWVGSEVARAKVVNDLGAEGLIRPDEVVDIFVQHTPYGYPIMELGFEADFDAVTDYLAGIVNLRSTGRQGAFTYPNMHGAMRMGATAAMELLASAQSSGPLVEAPAPVAALPTGALLGAREGPD